MLSIGPLESKLRILAVVKRLKDVRVSCKFSDLFVRGYFTAPCIYWLDGSSTKLINRALVQMIANVS